MFFFLLLLGQLKGNFVFDQNKKVKNKNHSQTTKIPLKEKKIKLVSRGFFFLSFHNDFLLLSGSFSPPRDRIPLFTVSLEVQLCLLLSGMTHVVNGGIICLRQHFFLSIFSLSFPRNPCWPCKILELSYDL